MFPIIILSIVFILIAVRQLGRFRIEIWQAMAAGAASNVIIIQNAEKKAGETLTFWEFARVGFPITFINAIIYWLFLGFI